MKKRFKGYFNYYLPNQPGVKTHYFEQKDSKQVAAIEKGILARCSQFCGSIITQDKNPSTDMAGVKTNLKDLGASFRKLIDSSFIKYRGVTIEKTTSGFLVYGETHDSEQSAKGAIDNRIDSLISKQYKDGN